MAIPPRITKQAKAPICRILALLSLIWPPLLPHLTRSFLCLFPKGGNPWASAPVLKARDSAVMVNSFFILFFFLMIELNYKKRGRIKMRKGVKKKFLLRWGEGTPSRARGPSRRGCVFRSEKLRAPRQQILGFFFFFLFLDPTKNPDVQVWVV